MNLTTLCKDNHRILLLFGLLSAHCLGMMLMSGLNYSPWVNKTPGSSSHHITVHHLMRSVGIVAAVRTNHRRNGRMNKQMGNNRQRDISVRLRFISTGCLPLWSHTKIYRCREIRIIYYHTKCRLLDSDRRSNQCQVHSADLCFSVAVSPKLGDLCSLFLNQNVFLYSYI